MDPDSGENRGGSVASDLGVLHRYLLGLLAVLVLVLVVGGARAFGWDVITRVKPAWPMIFPYTILGVLALLLAMVLFDRGGRGGRLIGRALAVLTLLLGAGVDIGVSGGWLPVSDPTAVPTTWPLALPSVGTIAVAISILMLSSTRDRWPRTRFWLAFSGGVVALFAFLSYIYGSASLFSSMGMTGTSMPAAILGLLVVGAAVTARPDRPPLASWDERYDRALVRRVLPLLVAILFVPALIGWLVNRLDPESASAAAVAQLVTVVILLVIIIVAGGGQSRARRAIASERQRLWDAFAHTPAATAMIGVDGRILLANTAWGRLLAVPEADLQGVPIVDLVAEQDRGTVARGLTEVMLGSEALRMDVRLMRADAGTVWVDAGAAPVRDTYGQVTYVVMQCSDLTDRKHLERVLSDQATRDPLTGLLNREGLTRQLRERTSALPHGLVTTVVYADVDGLKAVNDTIGHAAGDEMLREVARRLSASTNDGDIVARVGGDEFLVIATTSVTREDPAALAVERLRSELTGPLATGAEIVSLAVSLGAAVLDGTGDLAAAVAEADEAMYIDKRRRRLPKTR